MKRRFVWLSGFLMTLAIGCGSEQPTAYDDQTRQDFLAACSAQLDSQLVVNLCDCAYGEVKDRLSFGELIQWRESKDGPGPYEIPAEVEDAIVFCLTSEAATG